MTESEKLHRRAADLRAAATAFRQSLTREITYGALGALRDHARVVMREAGAMLRRARSAELREKRMRMS